MKKRIVRTDVQSGPKESADAKVAITLLRLVQETHRVYEEYQKLHSESSGGCLWWLDDLLRPKITIYLGEVSQIELYSRLARSAGAWVSQSKERLVSEARNAALRTERGILVVTGEMGRLGCEALLLVVAELAEFKPLSAILEDYFALNKNYQRLREEFLPNPPGNIQLPTSI